MSDDPAFPHTLATDHKRRLRVVLVDPVKLDLLPLVEGEPLPANAAHHALHVLAMKVLSLEAEVASLRDVDRQTREVLARAIDVNPAARPLVTLATDVANQLPRSIARDSHIPHD